MVEPFEMALHELVATQEDDGLRLDAVLARRLGIGRGEAHQLILEGRVAVAPGAAVKPSLTIREGAAITIAPAPGGAEVEEAVEEPRLVYQDELIAVVDKPAGLVVHPAPGHRGKTLADIVRDWGGLGPRSRKGAARDCPPPGPRHQWPHGVGQDRHRSCGAVPAAPCANHGEGVLGFGARTLP